MTVPMPLHLAALREEGLERLRAGDFEGAYALAERGCAQAEESGDRELRDLWVCNRASVAIELRRAEREVPVLRDILNRGGGGATGWQASYHLTRYYEWAKDFRKALFYGRIAVDRATELDNPQWLRGSRNVLGNALLGLSRTAEAASEYARGLESDDTDDAERGVLLGNLGYCALLEGRLRDGRRMLLESLKRVRQVDRAHELRTRLDLAFAALEAGRFGRAGRHARLALALARATGEVESIKNALYLQGEAEHLAGHADAASAVFSALQREFYPDQPYLASFLSTVDVRKVVNLHA